jgi:hypothetical protein
MSSHFENLAWGAWVLPQDRRVIKPAHVKLVDVNDGDSAGQVEVNFFDVPASVRNLSLGIEYTNAHTKVSAGHVGSDGVQRAAELRLMPPLEPAEYHTAIPPVIGLLGLTLANAPAVTGEA